MQVGERAGLEGVAGEYGHGGPPEGNRCRWASGPALRCSGRRPVMGVTNPSRLCGRIHFRASSSRVERAHLLLAAQHPPHVEEVAHGGDVVHAHDRRARVGGPAARGERPGQALGRRAARDRAQEVLARDRQQQRPAERAQPLEVAQHRDRLRRRLGEVRARVEHELLVARRPGARATAHALAQERHDVGDDVVVVGEALVLRRRARVHDDERRARRARRASASAGSRSPLTSLIIAAPASQRRVGDAALVRVDRDADALGHQRARTSGTTRAASVLGGALGAVGDARLAADVDEVGARPRRARARAPGALDAVERAPRRRTSPGRR